MTVKECYEMMNADYEETLGRLMKEDRIEKYLHKFADGNYMEEIESTMGQQDWESAFRAVHSMKGMSANLGLTGLQDASLVLCEALRDGAPTVDTTQMLEDVRASYRLVIDAIGQL